MNNVSLDKKKIGKKSRAEGKAFEPKVYQDLSKRDWIVNRWNNDVEFEEKNCGSLSDIIFNCTRCGEHKFLFDNPGNGILCNDFPIGGDINLKIRRWVDGHAQKCGGEMKLVCEGPGCDKKIIGKLIQAKTKWRHTPRGMMPMNLNPGFPDYMMFKRYTIDSLGGEGLGSYYDIVGVECKINGKLDKLEKEKCQWYLDNHIFSKILIAEKVKVKNKIEIKYKDFKETYGKD